MTAQRRRQANAGEGLRLLAWTVVALILAGVAFARAPWRETEEAGRVDTAPTQTRECVSVSEVSTNNPDPVIGCPVLRFEIGSCYHEESLASYRHAICGTPYASVRLTKRIDGVSDESRCDEDTYRIIIVPSPQTTFCLSKP